MTLLLCKDDAGGAEADQLADAVASVRIAEQRKLALEPFERTLPLRAGKYAEVGEYVRIVGGDHTGRWGAVSNITMNRFSVALDGGGDVVDFLSHEELQTTALPPKRVAALRAAHEARAHRLRARSSHVQSEEMSRRLAELRGATGAPLRLTAPRAPVPAAVSKEAARLRALKASAEYAALLAFSRAFSAEHGRPATRRDLRAAAGGAALLATHDAFRVCVRAVGSRPNADADGVVI